MNIDTVWTSFCDSCNGILGLLEDFDTWHAGQTRAQNFPADDFPMFVRHELDRAVKQAHDDLKMMKNRRESAGVRYDAFWRSVMNVNGGKIQEVKLTRTDQCRNSSASTVGPFTG